MISGTIVYGDYIAYQVQKIEGTSAQVPEGFKVLVQPIYADGGPKAVIRITRK